MYRPMGFEEIRYTGGDRVLSAFQLPLRIRLRLAGLSEMLARQSDPVITSIESVLSLSQSDWHRQR